jgi:hypothetical protein
MKEVSQELQQDREAVVVSCDWRGKARRFRDIWRGLCQAIPWRSERIYLKEEGGEEKPETGNWKPERKWRVDGSDPPSRFATTA